MTKKNMGLAKSKVVRVHPDDKTALKLVKDILSMSSRHGDGDVVHQLIEEFSKRKEDYEYKKLYEDLVQTNKVLKKTIDLLCEKQGIKFADAMEMVKCQI